MFSNPDLNQLITEQTQIIDRRTSEDHESAVLCVTLDYAKGWLIAKGWTVVLDSKNDTTAFLEKTIDNTLIGVQLSQLTPDTTGISSYTEHST